MPCPALGSVWSASPDKALRGGSWFNTPWSCRSAYRIHFQPDDAFLRVGFRVVCLPVYLSLVANDLDR